MNLPTTNTDHMPPEVALEYLTDPLKKITATFRKTCEQSRERVIPSTHPILNMTPKKDRRAEGADYVYTQSNFVPKETKLARKMASLSIRQLIKLIRRTKSRSEACVRAMGRTGARAAQEALARKAHGLDVLRAGADAVVQTRIFQEIV